MQRGGRSLLAVADQRLQPVVVQRPVDQRDVRVERAGTVQLAGQDPPETEQLLVARVGRLVGADVQRIQLRVRHEGARDRLQAARVRSEEAEQRTGPELRLIGAPEVVVGRALDGVVLALVVRERETHRDALLVEGLRLLGGVRLVVLAPRLRADHMLHPGEFEEFTGLGGVDDVTGGDRTAVAAARVGEGDGPYSVVVARLRGHRAVLGQQREQPGGAVRGDHRLHHRERDARLVAQLADAARTRIEGALGQRLGTQRVPLAVVVADGLAQGAVRGGGAELLDPRVLVRRDRLRGELAADPVRLLGEDDGAPRPAGGDGGGDPAESGAHDEDVGFGYHGSP